MYKQPLTVLCSGPVLQGAGWPTQLSRLYGCYYGRVATSRLVDETGLGLGLLSKFNLSWCDRLHFKVTTWGCATLPATKVVILLLTVERVVPIYAAGCVLTCRTVPLPGEQQGV